MERQYLVNELNVADTTLVLIEIFNADIIDYCVLDSADKLVVYVDLINNGKEKYYIDNSPLSLVNSEEFKNFHRHYLGEIEPLDYYQLIYPNRSMKFIIDKDLNRDYWEVKSKTFYIVLGPLVYNGHRDLVSSQKFELTKLDSIVISK